MAERFYPFGPRQNFAIDHGSTRNQNRTPASRATRIFDARAISIGKGALFAKNRAGLFHRDFTQRVENRLPFERVIDHTILHFLSKRRPFLYSFTPILKETRTFINKQRALNEHVLGRDHPAFALFADDEYFLTFIELLVSSSLQRSSQCL